MQFEIEALLPTVGSGVVFARQISGGAFSLGPDAQLGGVAIKPHVTSPRALNSDGTPRFDLFAFEVRSSNDLKDFSVGSLVALELQRAG